MAGTTPTPPADGTVSERIETYLRQQIADAIRRGDLRLPPMRAVMKTLGVYRVPVKTVVDSLVAEGLIEVRAQSGMYARDAQRVARDLVGGVLFEFERAVTGDGDGQLGLFEQMTGVDPGDLHVECDYATGQPPGWVAERLELDPAEPVLVRTFTYAIKGAPYQVAWSYLPLPVAERAGLRTPADERVGLGTIAHLMNGGMKVTVAVVGALARTATANDRQLLGVPAATPVLVLRRTLYTGKGRTLRPVEVTDTPTDGTKTEVRTRVELDAAAVRKGRRR